MISLALTLMIAGPPGVFILPVVTALLLFAIGGREAVAVVSTILFIVAASIAGAGLVIGLYALAYDITVYNDKQPTWHYWAMGATAMVLLAIYVCARREMNCRYLEAKIARRRSRRSSEESVSSNPEKTQSAFQLELLSQRKDPTMDATQHST
eukprot:FR735265.1.p1 GENE.FR735265.1~~FR735265.1.p1  ORF type:complete len:172 (+),score=4.70 FR735265.1:58-516(+)